MISSGSRDEYKETCVPTESESKSCLQYSGSIQVVHTADCSEEQVRDDTIDALADGMEKIPLQDPFTASKLV